MFSLLTALDATACLSWFLAAAVVFAAYVIWSQTHWSRHGVPQTRPTVLLGDVYEAMLMRRSAGEIAKEIYRRFDGKPFVGIYKFLTPILLVRDADLIKDVLIQNFTNFQNNATVFPDGKVGVFSDNPFVADAERWKTLRTRLSQLFTPARVRGSLSDMVESARRLADFLEAAGPDTSHDGHVITKRFTAHTSSRVLFGIESHSLDIGAKPGAFYDMGHQIFNGGFFATLRFIAFLNWPALLNILGYNFVSDETQSFFKKLIQDSVEYRSKENISRDDFVQHVTKQILSEGKIDEAALKVAMHQAINTYVETFETSGVISAAILLMLAIHPEEQEKVREELRAKVPSGKPLQEETVASLTYLEQVIKETLRFYPPLDVARKMCTKTTTLVDPAGSGATVKLHPGDVVYLPVEAIHHDPAFYSHPNQFWPEHFSEEESASRHKIGYMGFGEGPRQCPGMRYAMQQMKVVLATLLLRFEVTPAPQQVLPLERDPAASILNFRGGIWLRFRPLW